MDWRVLLSLQPLDIDSVVWIHAVPRTSWEGGIQICLLKIIWKVVNSWVADKEGRSYSSCFRGCKSTKWVRALAKGWLCDISDISHTVREDKMNSVLAIIPHRDPKIHLWKMRRLSRYFFLTFHVTLIAKAPTFFKFFLIMFEFIYLFVIIQKTAMLGLAERMRNKL